MAWMFLNGEGMRGGTAHEHIAGSAFVGEARTAPLYRFLAFGWEFPGLLPVDRGGAPITGELYDVPLGKLQRLLRAEPPQLELSIVTLSDGQPSLGMVVRAGQEINSTITDITEIGSWRRHLSTRA
ncbi:MAG: allophanate hydrolase-related protein [Trebonia sp.]